MTSPDAELAGLFPPHLAAFVCVSTERRLALANALRGMNVPDAASPQRL